MENVKNTRRVKEKVICPKHEFNIVTNQSLNSRITIRSLSILNAYSHTLFPYELEAPALTPSGSRSRSFNTVSLS
jgi:hypothetical protein